MSRPIRQLPKNLQGRGEALEVFAAAAVVVFVVVDVMRRGK